MRTSAPLVGSQQLDSLKKWSPNVDFSKTENSCHCSFEQQPHPARKNLGSAPILRPIRSNENVETTSPRHWASHFGQTPLVKERYWDDWSESDRGGGLNNGLWLIWHHKSMINPAGRLLWKGSAHTYVIGRILKKCWCWQVKAVKKYKCLHYTILECY